MMSHRPTPSGTFFRHSSKKNRTDRAAAGAISSHFRPFLSKKAPLTASNPLPVPRFALSNPPFSRTHPFLAQNLLADH